MFHPRGAVGGSAAGCSQMVPCPSLGERRRRRTRLEIGEPSCGGCFHLLCVSNERVFGGGSKLSLFLLCGNGRGSFRRSFALSWALEEEAPADVFNSQASNLDSVTMENAANCCSKVDQVGKDVVNFSEEDDVETDTSPEEKDDSGNVRVGELTGDRKARLDVRALAQSLWDSNTADDVEGVLGKLEEIHPTVYSSMIKGFGMDKKMDAAFALVEWLKRKRKECNGAIVPNVIIYNSLLGALRQSGEYVQADRIMADMAEQGILPNIVTYNTLMYIYIEQGKHAEARSVLAHMEDKGISPSPATYSTALLTYQKTGDASGAIVFFSELRDKHERGEIARTSKEDWEFEFVKLKNFTIRICYQVIRQWLIKGDNQTSRILRLFADMDKAGLFGGRSELEKLAWACTSEAHHVVARELYRRIRNLETGISLSVCNHIIWLMGKAKKWWTALEIYEDLLDEGPKPNNLSYELIISHFNILLSAARKRGIWRWGLRLLNKMQDKGLRPGAREWNAVLVACSKASETSAAVQIFRRMVDYGEKPTIVSYGALLSALEKGKLYDEALRVWDHMCKMGIKPNLYAYTILASIYTGNGRLELVDSVIRDMTSSGIEPTVVTFNAIISGCARNNLGSAAFEWFHRMKVRNIIPNEITYEMLVEALARDGKPRLAYEMYLRAHNEGLRLSAKAYDAVMRSCQLYGASIDIDILGPRPPEMRNIVNSGKTLPDIYDKLADVSRRHQPFVREDLFSVKTYRK